MKKVKSKDKIKKGIKYGVFNITDNFVETHHRTLNAAYVQCKRRNAHWGKEKEFETVEIYN